uniref:Uncharacterized protein n=1 Tax=Trichogramma kaykai TaxID=54128 RepID=A0ABD2VTH5_9HYME
MQMLLQNVTARGMWSKVEEMSAEDAMTSLRDKRLNDQGGEQICRERLFRARLRRLPATIRLDVPWDVNLDDLPDQRSSNESLLDQTMIETPDDGARKSAQVPGTENAMFGGDFEARLMGMISEAVRREVNWALGERAKPPVDAAGAEGGGARQADAPLSHEKRPPQEERVDEALIEWLYRLEQQGKLRVPTLGEVLAHCELPRGEIFTPKPGEEGAIANFPRDSENCRSGQRAADRRDDMAMVTPSRDTVADARSGPVALSRSIENLPDRQCDRNERENAPIERSDPDEITLVSSECVAAPHFSTQDTVCEDESEPEEAHEIITRAEIHETSETNQQRMAGKSYISILPQ